MFRRVAFASITGLSLITSCVATNDDDGEETGGSSGRAGARGGSSGSSGASPSAGRAGGVGGSGGVVGGAPGAGTAGTLSEGGDGGTSTEPQAGAGGTPSSSGSGGTGAIGTAGDGGAPVIEAGSGGAPVIEGGSGGAPVIEGGSGGDGTEPTPEGGMGGMGDMGGMGGMGGEGNESVGLVVHYEFDENTGATSVDSTGRFGDATLADGATFVPGRAGTSGVELSAATAHVVLAPMLFEGVERATIATWVNMAEYLPWSRVFEIPGTNGGIFLAPDRGTGPADGLTFRLPYNGTDALVETDIDLPLDVWKHVAVTLDGPTYSMFVDGYPIATAQTNAWMPSQIEPTAAGWLGKSFNPADYYFKGSFDDFRVYDEVLPQNEIADLAWPDSDYSYFRFDETSGTVVGDSSDRAFDGEIFAGAGFTPGKVGNALSLLGASSQYVAIPPGAVSSCQDFTIAVWANLTSVGNWTRIFDYWASPDRFLYFTPGFPAGGGQQLRFTFFNGADHNVIAPYPTGTVLAGQWHHFAFTLSGTEGRLYFNGAQIGMNATMGATPASLTAGTTARAWIGRSLFPDPYLNGLIDDLRISCRAFTAQEIKALAQ